jgi:hypothetical protein
LQQRLRLAKQRLVEGTLTEAEQVLEQVLQTDAGDSRVQELKRRVADEKQRRERRQRLTAVQQRARELWMELKYADCEAVLDEGLQQFPGDVELLKLRQTAQQDRAEFEKQQQLAQARKCLGQQQFVQARAILEKLKKEHPLDVGLAKLQALIEEREIDLRQRQRLAEKLVDLRGLVKEQRLAEAVVQGEELLREYPQDFELKELVGYARVEFSQRQLQEKEQLFTQQIQELLSTKRYVEAAAAAKRAGSEFAGNPQFQKLREEAERKRKEQTTHDEFQRRIQEIQQKINRQSSNDLEHSKIHQKQTSNEL